MTARIVSFAALAFAALLVSCGGGGGGGNAATCIASVQAGPVPGDVAGGPGGVGDGAGGDGAGSAGGVEGQFKRALIQVEQADGKVVGEAQVDDTYGMVRIELCRYRGPVKFTLRGKADGSTVYYDEGKGTELPFPANETIHAVIASYDKNVGITPLTEAAYQYLVAKYGVDGWKSAANVNEANEAIRTEFNRYLPAGLQITDITRLPAIVGPATGPGTLPASPNGLYGAVISGLAQAAALFNVGDVTPALSIARQIGRDLSDGKLDLFYCSNGDPANCTPAPVFDGKTFTTGQSTYSTPQFPEMVNTGISQISAKYGDTRNQGAALQFTQIKVFSPGSSSGVGYLDTSPIFLLRNDGNVYFWPRRDRPMTLYDTGYRQLYGASSMLGSKRDGRVVKDPVITYPPANEPDASATVAFPPPEVTDYFGTTRIAGTATTFSSSFNQIVRKQDGNAYLDISGGSSTGGTLGPAQVADVVDVAVARGGAGAGSFYVARADGRVLAWGWNGTQSTLGLDLSDTVVAAPTLNRTLANIVSVAGCIFGGFAVNRDGLVWGWGAGSIECASITSRTPVLVDSVNAFGPIGHLQCGSFWGCIGLTRRGEMIVWGYFRDSADGQVYPTAPIKLTLPAGRRGIYVGATGLFVYGLLDDGKIVVFKARPENPTFIDTSGVIIR